MRQTSFEDRMIKSQKSIKDINHKFQEKTTHHSKTKAINSNKQKSLFFRTCQRTEKENLSPIHLMRQI